MIGISSRPNDLPERSKELVELWNELRVLKAELAEQREQGERIAKELGRLHAESLEAWEARTIAANKERRNGTRPRPSDKPESKEIKP